MPSWRPLYKGILLFGGLYWGPLFAQTPTYSGVEYRTLVANDIVFIVDYSAVVHKSKVEHYW